MHVTGIIASLAAEPSSPPSVAGSMCWRLNSFVQPVTSSRANTRLTSLVSHGRGHARGHKQQPHDEQLGPTTSDLARPPAEARRVRQPLPDDLAVLLGDVARAGAGLDVDVLGAVAVDVEPRGGRR